MFFVTSDRVAGRFVIDLIYDDLESARKRIERDKEHPMARPCVLAWPESAPLPDSADQYNHTYDAYWQSDLDRLGVERVE